jgi:hypothetical protein
VRRVKAGRVYVFQPVGMDLWDSRTLGIKPGDLVRVVNLYGCPPANTMAHCHIETADGGEFAGLVMTASLQPESAES